jgi:alkanesulfonate monooxygenase SsuD/methylene tetrahydromethanopterin reductase-like flavin-dependent oxidoreductase (luciferase family)
MNMSPEELSQRLTRLSEFAADAARPISEIRIFVCPSTHPVTTETVAQYAELGVEQLIVPVMAGNLDKLRSRMERMMAITGL